MNKKEIISSCCAFGSGCEEVHVLSSDCPINRELGRRIVNTNDGDREECTCVYNSAFGFGGVTRCEFYKGTTQVQRDKRKVYKVECARLELNK